jgi:hypothetical protein
VNGVAATPSDGVTQAKMVVGQESHPMNSVKGAQCYNLDYLGLSDFSVYDIPKREKYTKYITIKYTKWPQNIPTRVKLIKWQQNMYTNIFHCKSLQNLPGVGFLV